MNDIFIVGCGDIGGRLARRLIDDSRSVAALARSEASADRLREFGVEPVAGDLDRAGELGPLPISGKVVFYFAPPPTRGENDPRMAAFLGAVGDEKPRKVIYLSTSGVYGDRGGDWVDEETPPNPQTARAKRRIDAETRLREWGREHGVPVVVVRVGGIYGPGRLPLARLRRGEPLLREAECGYTNRIHADDLVSVCIAAAERGGADRVYNVSDGRPGNMTGYFKAVAAHAGLPIPEEIPLTEAKAQLSEGMLSYLLESRRMDNRRMVEELKVTLGYPDLEAGLKAIAFDKEGDDDTAE